MSGRYDPAEPEPRHECRPPGALSRWFHRVREGRVWRCDCSRGWCWEVPHLATWPRWVPLGPPTDEVLDAVLGPLPPEWRR